MNGSLVTDNVEHWRSTGISIPSAHAVDPIKEQNFYLTTIKLRH